MESLRSLAWFVVLGGTIGAQSVTIPIGAAGAEGSSSTPYPWDRRTGQIRLQDVYDASNFTAQGVNRPILITRARWRADDTTSSWTGGQYANAAITLGPSRFDHAQASIGFDANYRGGVKPTAAYTGPVRVLPGIGNGTGVPGPTYVDVTFSTPVAYDPASGDDLIIEIQLDGQWSGGGSFAGDLFSSTSVPAPAANRLYDLGDAQAPTATSLGIAQALVCELDYTTATTLAAAFFVDRANAGPGETVQFTDASFSPTGITSWAWDFDGDGATDSTQRNPSHAFTACGSRDVRLTVTDASGSDTITNPGVVTITRPVASFTFVPTPAPAAITFTDTSVNQPTNWDWDLDGDGTVDATTQNPTWAYTTGGLYRVTQTTTNACGASTSTAMVDTRSGLCTTFAGGNGLPSGVTMYFDANVTDPAGLTVSWLDVHNSSAGASVVVDVFVAPTTWVGIDDLPAAWTHASTGTGTSSGDGLATPIDVADFCLPAGQWGIALHYTSSAGTNRYSAGGNTYANAELSLTLGRARAGFFSGGFSDPRTWNGCVYYRPGVSPGSLVTIGRGCTNSTGAIAEIDGQGGMVPVINRGMTFEISRAPANVQASLVMLGMRDLGGVLLDPIGMHGCRLHADPLVGLPAPTDAAGVGSAAFMIPNLYGSIGMTFWVQAFIADRGHNPFGAVLSDAAQGVIGCH